MGLNYLKSKKGILIEGTAIIIVFLLSTAVVYLLWDNPESHEELKIGQMLLDVYSAEQKAEEFEYFFEKSSEYALLKSLKESINVGLLEGTDCVALYDPEKGEECYVENLADVFAKNLAKKTGKIFVEDFDKDEYNLDPKQLIFVTRNIDKKLTLNVKSDEKVDLGRNSEREMVYNVSIDFDVELDFNLRDYENIIQPLKNNLDCLESKGDIGSEELAVSGCLNAYPEFSNLKVEDGILMFDYAWRGVLFEKKLTGPLKLNLNGFKRAMMGNIA